MLICLTGSELDDGIFRDFVLSSKFHHDIVLYFICRILPVFYPLQTGAVDLSSFLKSFIHPSHHHTHIYFRKHVEIKQKDKSTAYTAGTNLPKCWPLLHNILYTI